MTPQKQQPHQHLIQQTPSSCSVHFHHHNTRFQTPVVNSVDFQDAKLVIERNTDGKHVVGKILLNSNIINQNLPAATTPLNNHHELVLSRSSSHANLVNNELLVLNNKSGISVTGSNSSHAITNTDHQQRNEMNGLLRNANSLFFSNKSKNVDNKNEQSGQSNLPVYQVTINKILKYLI